MNKLYDEHAEKSVLGAMMLRKEAAFTAIDMVRAQDFYFPLHSRVFTAIEDLISEGIKIDITTVGAKLQDNDIIPQLASWSIDTPNPGNVADYANIVYDRSMARQLAADLSESLTLLKQGDDPYETAANVDRMISEIGSARNTEPESLTMDELASRADAIAPVVIPGLMNQDYRTIVVGSEGAGKSVLIRTIAMSASQGLHPFSHSNIRPIRALIVDLENPAQGILETGKPFMDFMRVRNPEAFDADRLRVWRRPAGIDIRKIADRADLQREIAAHKPDLVCMGPVYKMYQRKGSETYEDSADDAMHVLDALRIKYGFALVLEHHAAKGRKDDREMSPFGSQRWMAWPEAGISLYADKSDPTVTRVDRFRGDRLAGVQWPDKISRDRQWLVTGTWEHGVPDVCSSRPRGSG